MMTRDPLHIPGLTDGKPEQLARTLRLVEARQSSNPLPVVDKLPPAQCVPGSPASYAELRRRLSGVVTHPVGVCTDD